MVRAHPHVDAIGPKVHTRDSADFRAESRVPILYPATVRIVYPADKLERNPVEITEISNSGVRFVASWPYCVGSIIQIQVASSTNWGEVRHCTPLRVGYEVGVHIDAAYSSQDFQMSATNEGTPQPPR